jgi:hypothetical protein
MDQKKKDNLLELIGFIFAGIYIYVLILFFSTNYIQGLFWGCYIGILIITISIFLKNSDLLCSQIFLILIPDLLWILDFFSQILFGNSIIGLDNSFFTSPFLSRKILSLHHLLTPILSLTALSLLRPPKKFSKSLLISFIELFLIFVISPYLNFKDNINCLPSSQGCILFNLPFYLPYALFWIMTTSFFILISFLLIKFVYFKLVLSKQTLT